MGTTIFAEMSALAGATGSINLGQGFPDTDGPPEIARGGRCRDHGGTRQPVPARPGHPASCGRRSPRTRSGSTASTLTRTREVLVTAGATEAIAAALHRPAGTGGRGHRVRALLRLLRRLHRHGRGAAGCRSPSGRPASAPTWTRCAPPSPPRTRLILLNTPHNPTGAVFTPDGARRDRRAGLRARPAGGLRRGLRAPGLRGSSTCPIATLPGMRGADGDDQFGGEDVLVHRLEDRLGDREPGAGHRGAHRQAVPHLRHRRAVPVRGRRGARPARHLLRRDQRGPAGQA